MSARDLIHGDHQQKEYSVAKSYDPEELAKRVFYLAMIGFSVQIAIIVLLVY